MNDGELFSAQPSTPPRLTTARQRAEKAEAAYNAAEEHDERYDGLGVIPEEIEKELREARRELAAAEAAEYRSRSGL